MKKQTLKNKKTSIKNKQIMNLDVPIRSSENSWSGDVSLRPNETYKLHIDYPLSNPAVFKIKVGKTGLTATKLVKKICEAYEKIYEVDDAEQDLDTDELTYGVWGHSIEDLYLNSIMVDHTKKEIYIELSS